MAGRYGGSGWRPGAARYSQTPSSQSGAPGRAPTLLDYAKNPLTGNYELAPKGSVPAVVAKGLRYAPPPLRRALQLARLLDALVNTYNAGYKEIPGGGWTEY